MQFQSSWNIQPCLSKIAHMCQLSIFFSLVFYTWNLFSLRKWNLCVFVSRCAAFWHVLAGALTIEALGEGPGRHLSAFLASVISGHSAVLEGLRNRVRRVGGELVIDESQTPNNCPMLMTKEREESLKNFYCALMKKIFWKWLIYKIAHGNIFRSQFRKPLSILCYRFHCF